MSNNVIYNIGLDLGTNSIGWAVTSNDFRVIKKGNHKLWGVLLFDEGQSSKAYRSFRSSRRRLERRRERINLLQNLMSDSIVSVDPTFYKRLNMSYLCNEVVDKYSKRSYKYNLFNDSITDIDFFKKFKTIYHLRNYLMNSNKKEDIRYIYLALHHIVKYRGNFLHQEDELEINSANILNSIEVFLQEYLFDEHIKPNSLLDILISTNIIKKEKEKMILELFANKELGAFCAKLLVGYSIDVKLFKKTFKIDEEIESTKLQFGNDEFDVNFEKLNKYLLSKDVDMILCMKSLFEDLMLIKILGDGNSTVSIAMINRYKKHENDLLILKSVLKTNKKLYRDMFKSEDNLVNYVNYVNKSDKGTKSGKRKCTREEFYKYVSKVLSEIDDSDKKLYILRSISEDSFMPLINDVINSSIPYQLNFNEAKKILDNQKQYYSELNDNYFKILSIIKFRRPYSVGVLRPESRFSWIGEAPKDKVYPWNFDELVDLNKANENFIRKMVSRDAYTGDFVLPLEAITYQKFIVLNELNNIRYKNDPLNIDIKKKVFEIFKNKTSVSCADIIRVYKNEYNIECQFDDFSGFSDIEHKKFLSSMNTYIKFKKLLGEDFNEKDIKLYDKVVESITIFKDSKVLQGVLDKLFDSTSHSHLKKYTKQLIKFSFNKWGKYSYKLLDGILSKDNKHNTIIELLYDSQNNFMQIINDAKYGYLDDLNHAKTIDHPSYKNLIEDLYASAAVKKTVWNAYKIVAETIKIMGCKPNNVFIETTREEKEKKKTVSKIDMLGELYKSLGEDISSYNAESIKLELSKIDSIDRDKLYLYFLQLGRCMYTNKPIDINRLDECEIDHIVPRCYIKDDSFDNRVLVFRDANQRKSDLALSNEIREKCKDFWYFLYQHGNKKYQFISKKKYDSLMMSSWDESAISGFINRQLVETTQINKLTRDVLLMVYPELDNNIRFVNSGLVTLFRNCQATENCVDYGNFIKIRNLNDLHHAKDAFLVSVLGTFTSENYCSWGQDERALHAKELLNNGLSKYSANELINTRYGVIIDKLKSFDYECVSLDGEYISGKNAFNNIVTMMDFNDISVVKLKEEYANSSFYNQTIYSPKCNKKLASRKQIKQDDGEYVDLNTNLYGGYSNINDAYFLSISYMKGKNANSKIVGIPVLVAEQSKYINSNQPILQYLCKQGYSNPTINGKPIRRNQLINYHGQNVYITGESEIVNATQLLIDKQYMYILKCICDDRKQQISNMKNFKDQAIDFINMYVDKMKQYYPLFSTIAQKIDEFVKGDIVFLSNDDLCKYIKNLLLITHSDRIDMPKEWNGGAEWGRLKGKTISKNDNDIKWIDSSITGYYLSKSRVFEE